MAKQQCVNSVFKIESLIEDLIKKIKIENHFPKVSDNKMKMFMTELAKQFGAPTEEINEALGSFIYSGSFMEGAFLARNLNPKQKQRFYEAEFDMMFPLGRIVNGKEADVIQELDYAKGFVWLKYDENNVILEAKNRKKTKEFLFEHNGQLYLDSVPFKLESNLDKKPALDYFNRFVEELQGPSNNVDAIINLKGLIKGMKNTTKDGMTKAAHILDKCLGFIQRASPALESFHQFITKELSNFEGQFKNGELNFKEIDMEEFGYKRLPTNRGEENLLIKIHWSMLAFFINVIAVIETFTKIIVFNKFEENVGFWGFPFLPLLRHPISLKDAILKYYLHLFSLPTMILQKFTENPNSAIEMFIEEFLHKQPKEIEEVLRAFRRCISVLGPRFHVFQAIAYDFKDNNAINDDADELNLNIDRVPAITVSSWPAIAEEWKVRDRHWPPQNVLNNILTSGCHIVPKPYTGIERNENLDWRWSFTRAEMLLAHARSDKMNFVYLILKTMFYMYLKVIEVDERTLPSYLVKTLMLWQCESSTEDWWQQKSVPDCVIGTLEKFKTCFYQRNLQHYFIRDLNLFSNIPEELISYGTAIIESICLDPLTCIKDVLVNLVQWQSKYKSKTDKQSEQKSSSDVSTKTLGRDMSEDQIKQEANIPLSIAEFRETIKIREKKFKNIPEKQGALALLRRTYDKEMRERWPKQFEESLSIQTSYTEGNISFHLLFNSIDQDLNFTNIISIRFKGSGLTNLELNLSG